MAVIQMKQLLESGVHFGHQTRRWNPKMDKYIYTSRHGIHIIDLQQTVGYIEDAYKRFLDIGKEGGKVLFVGTKKQAQDVIVDEATRAGQFYVSKRWLGGTLTNFKTIRKSIRRLHDIRQMEKDGTFQRLPKKEVIGLRKELERLETFLGGIQEMRTLPDAVFIVDPRKEINAIREAKKLKIPVFGMVDTNCDPDELDFIIPANDDAIRSIKLIVGKMAEALIEGGGGIEQGATEPTDKKVVEPVTEKPAQQARPQRPRPAQQARPQRQEAPKKEVKPVAPKPEPKPEPKPVAPKPQPEKVEAVKAVKPEPKKEVKPQAKPSLDQDALESKTVVELRTMAKEKGLTGYSKLKKAELIDALLS